MSSRDENNHQDEGVDLPGFPGSGLSEDAALAWIEGTLSREEDARLSREHPELARHVRLMRGDRASLAALGTARAPASVALGVVERLSASAEREMLLGVAQAERGAPAGEIPVSRVEVRREGVLARIGGRRLAMAAGLALACGVTFLAWRIVRDPGTPGSLVDHGRLARTMTADGPGNPGPIASHGELDRVEAPTAGPGDAGMATVLADAGSQARAMKSAAPEPVEISTKDELAWAGESAGTISAVSVAMPAERALSLAREGRLMVRVVASSPRAKVEGVRSGEAGAWRWGDSVPVAMASAVTSWRGEHVAPAPAWSAPERVFTSTLEFREGLASYLPPAPPPSPAEDSARTLVVDCELCERSLGELREKLAKVEGVAAVEFVELDSAVGPGSERPRSERLLWWTRPTGEWSPRASLPVLVDSGE